MRNLLCMPCTSAANCGVGSNDCFQAFQYSMPPHMIDVMQEMRRVDRGCDAEPGYHRYEIFLSFNVVMNLFLRIFQNDSKTVRAHEMEQLFIVLRFLVLPSMCYHTFIEQYFEPLDAAGNPSHNNAQPCGNICTYYLRGHLLFTLEFDRVDLRNILISEVFWPDGRITVAKFQKRYG